MKEVFAIPGVAGLIVKKEENIEYILIQDRSKKGSESEEGLRNQNITIRIRKYANLP